MAMDGATHMGTGYLDIRISFGFLQHIVNVHVCALPFNDSHTGLVMYNMIVKLFGALYPQFLEKLIGITSDGASNQMGISNTTQKTTTSTMTG